MIHITLTWTKVSLTCVCDPFACVQTHILTVAYVFFISTVQYQLPNVCFSGISVCKCLWMCCAHTQVCGCNFILSVFTIIFFGWCGTFFVVVVVLGVFFFVIFFFFFFFCFISFVYTNSVLCTENTDLSNVLLRVSFPISVHTGTTVVVQRQWYNGSSTAVVVQRQQYSSSSTAVVAVVLYYYSSNYNFHYYFTLLL